MGLSNYLPSSRISQAGVIPNAAARPASPYEGQLVYQMDDNSLYIYDGSNWVKSVSASQPNGLQLIKTVSSTSQNNFDVSDCFSSEFANYRIVLSTTTASTNTLIYFRYVTSSGVFSNSNYWWQGIDYTGASSVTGLSNGGSGADKSRLIFHYTSYAEIIIELNNPNLARHTLAQTYCSSWNPSGTNLTNQISHIINTNDVFTGIRFGLFDNGAATFSGTARVYGYRN